MLEEKHPTKRQIQRQGYAPPRFICEPPEGAGALFVDSLSETNRFWPGGAQQAAGTRDFGGGLR